jgi:hypothetical protein
MRHTNCTVFSFDPTPAVAAHMATRQRLPEGGGEGAGREGAEGGGEGEGESDGERWRNKGERWRDEGERWGLMGGTVMAERGRAARARWRRRGGTVMADRWVFFPWGLAAESGSQELLVTDVKHKPLIDKYP